MKAVILAGAGHSHQRGNVGQAKAHIEQAREVLIWEHLPNWFGLGIYTLAAITIAWADYTWFQKTRKGFADVL